MNLTQLSAVQSELENGDTDGVSALGWLEANFGVVDGDVRAFIPAEILAQITSQEAQAAELYLVVVGEENDWRWTGTKIA